MKRMTGSGQTRRRTGFVAGNEDGAGVGMIPGFENDYVEDYEEDFEGYFGENFEEDLRKILE